MENKRETTLVGTQTSRARNTETHRGNNTEAHGHESFQQSRDIRNQDGAIIQTPAQEHKKRKEEPEER